MSGICGILRLDGQAVAQSDLDRQMTRLSHLGTDRIRCWHAGRIGLVHLMTRVTTEDVLDAQPLHDADISLVADLRLDNREELADALSIGGAELAQMPDSALLFAAYKFWGPDCVNHLLGDFAFAVWDARTRALTLARDHMGQRHVFYHRGSRIFAFATEIKALWALPEVPRVLLEDRLVQGLPPDRLLQAGMTIFDGVYVVPGGTVLTVGADGTVTSRRYWEPRADPAHEGRDEAYYVDAYRTVLGEAVACRLRRTIAPAAVLMGGGFDSTAICALAGPAVRAQGRKLITVSSVMPEDYRGSIRHARRWVEICRRQMPHLDVRYVTREGLDILTGMEAAFLGGDNRHSPNRYVTEALLRTIADAGARTVIDGFGGDYTVNPRGQFALIRLLRTWQFRRFIAEFLAMRRHSRQSIKQTLVRNVLWPLMPVSWTRALSRYRNGLPLSGPTMPILPHVLETQKTGSRERPRRSSGDGQRAGIERMLRWQQDTSARSGSIAAARLGLVRTQPFHDKRVVEFALAIPEDLYLKNGRSRHLARTALKDLYPPEFQGRSVSNDDMSPDVLTMAKRIEPLMLAEIDRMENAGRLSRYFDFARMRAMLTRRSVEQHASGQEFDTLQAMNAFIAARYIEWFRGDN